MHLASLNIKALSLKRHFLATFGNGGALWEVMHGDDSLLTYMCKIEVTSAKIRRYQSQTSGPVGGGKPAAKELKH